MHCTSCGKALDISARYCGNCGTPVSHKTPVAPPVIGSGVSGQHEPDGSPQAALTNAVHGQASPVLMTPLVKIGLSLIGGLMALGVVASLLEPKANTDQSGSGSTQRAKPQADPSAPRVLAEDTIGCSTEDAADKLMNISMANDKVALTQLLLTGACEIVLQGTALSYEGGIMTPRYRRTGTVATLYFPAGPTFR